MHQTDIDKLFRKLDKITELLEKLLEIKDEEKDKPPQDFSHQGGCI